MVLAENGNSPKFVGLGFLRKLDYSGGVRGGGGEVGGGMLGGVLKKWNYEEVSALIRKFIHCQKYDVHL